jgi:hypothetical protein
VLVGVAALLVLSEVAVRQAGLVEFPLYVLDAEYGYAPARNQSGAFLRRNRWTFNDIGLGVDATWEGNARRNLLLVGNSIVLGGNPYDQPDKLGPLLQRGVGPACAVWPVAAGGWTTVNEMSYLERHPELAARADFVVWEVMPGQMGRAQLLTREWTHPTVAPGWATAYLVRKGLGERFVGPPAAPPPTPAQLEDGFRRFDAMLGRMAQASRRSPPGIVFLYPDRAQLALARRGLEWAPERARIEALAAARRFLVVDVARDGRWSEALYRDAVHPTPEGNAVLAAILRDAMNTPVEALCGTARPPG